MYRSSSATRTERLSWGFRELCREILLFIVAAAAAALLGVVGEEALPHLIGLKNGILCFVIVVAATDAVAASVLIIREIRSCTSAYYRPVAAGGLPPLTDQAV
jgi:hypothetical protein